MPAVQPYAWLRVFTEVLSDFAFVPALAPLAAQRRHFPLACAVVQLLATVMYNLCDAVGARNVFIDRGAWHQVSDVLTLTYVGSLHVITHLMQHDEDIAAALRYAAFFLAWLFKLRDMWDSRLFEALLVGAYVVLLVFSVAQSPERVKHLDSDFASKGAVAAAVAVVLFGLSQALDDSLKLLMGGAHICAGFAFFAAWSAFPAPSKGQLARHVHSASSFV